MCCVESVGNYMDGLLVCHILCGEEVRLGKCTTVVVNDRKTRIASVNWELVALSVDR